MTGLVLIVGGYGAVGTRIAADLAADFPDRVVVAGRNLERATATAAARANLIGRRDIGGPWRSRWRCPRCSAGS